MPDAILRICDCEVTSPFFAGAATASSFCVAKFDGLLSISFEVAKEDGEGSKLRGAAASSSVDSRRIVCDGLFGL